MPEPFPHPLILGHRGAPLDAPENTLRSLALAMEQGADGVELDVQRTRDGVPVLLHDETLDRTTAARGPVEGLHWSAVQRLTGAGVPSLEQAAAWASAAGAWLNVEIKARRVERATVEALDAAGMLPRTVLSSFHPDVLAEVANLAPDTHRFFLTERWDPAAEQALAASRADGVCLHVDAATAPALDALRSLALPFIVWTVDEPRRIAELLQAGAAGIISNRPGLAARVREECGLGNARQAASRR